MWDNSSVKMKSKMVFIVFLAGYKHFLITKKRQYFLLTPN